MSGYGHENNYMICALREGILTLKARSLMSGRSRTRERADGIWCGAFIRTTRTIPAEDSVFKE